MQHAPHVSEDVVVVALVPRIQRPRRGGVWAELEVCGCRGGRSETWRERYWVSEGASRRWGLSP